MNLPVKKIELVLPKEGLPEIIDNLQKRGSLEIIPGNENSEEAKGFLDNECDFASSDVIFALSFLENFRPKENFIKNLIFSFVPIKENFTEEELKEIATSSKIGEVVRACGKLEEKINLLTSRKEDLLKELSIIKKFRGTTIFLDKEIEKVSYFAGTINIKNKENLFIKLKKNSNFFIEEGEEDSFIFSFVIFFPKKEKSFFLKILNECDAKEEDVFWNEHPKKAIEKRKKEIREIDIELEIQKKEVEKIVFYIPKLQALVDFLEWETEKKEFLKKAKETKKYFVISAWIAKNDISVIKKILKKETSYFLIKELPIKKEDSPPVIIENKGIASSFGIVAGVYGLPKKNEIDPTPYLAPFFIFYFALALSDAGYGILLAALAFLMKKMFKKANADKFFNLFIFCGVLTTVAGIFIGTFFGGEIIESLRIADPMSDPIGALMFVLALGVFQIFIGLVIGMIWLIKSGEVKQAISSNGAAVVFFIGFILYIITENIDFIISGAVAMALLSFLYAEAENIFQKIGKALGSLYGLIGFVGDILSYSRILALGLATGIIAAVINMIALIFKDMIPIPGLDFLIAGIVLVIGHTGNLLINALGAFIHSARLQFVEFFSKFMEGGGRHFKPLAKKGRYIEIIN